MIFEIKRIFRLKGTSGKKKFLNQDSIILGQAILRYFTLTIFIPLNNDATLSSSAPTHHNLHNQRSKNRQTATPNGFFRDANKPALLRNIICRFFRNAALPSLF